MLVFASIVSLGALFTWTAGYSPLYWDNAQNWDYGTAFSYPQSTDDDVLITDESDNGGDNWVIYLLSVTVDDVTIRGDTQFNRRNGTTNPRVTCNTLTIGSPDGETTLSLGDNVGFLTN
jgi:hypothetical protein